MNISVVALNKAIEIDQENLDFLLFLSSLQIELKNYKDAREVLERILELSPKNLDAKKMLKEIEDFED